MEWKVVLMMIGIYFAYLLLGALIFHSIERPLELERCVQAYKFLQKFEQNYTTNNNTLTIEEVKDLFDQVSEFRGHGIRFENRNITCSNHWNYESAIFFSGTIVTTIGYGNVFPTTNSSRLATVIYALIGIPLFAILYSGLAEKVGLSVRHLALHVDKLISSVRAENAIIFFSIGIIGFIFGCCIPSVIFMHVEGWSFGVGLYYSIITLTTIGFGDFVAGSNPNISYVTIYKVMVYFWILLGLAFMAVFLNIISERIKQKGRNATDGKVCTASPSVDILPPGGEKISKKNEANEEQTTELKEA